MRRRAFGLGVMIVALTMGEGAALAQTAAEPRQEPVVAVPRTAPQEADGARGFDFLVGRWKIHNRRLVGRLRGSTEWHEFEATSDCQSALGGLGSLDTFRTEYWPGFEGLSLRFFDPATKRWAIYWIDNKTGVLQPPVWGTFDGDVGVFEGPDELDGGPILVRFVWSRVGSASPRWEQAFSADEGKTWETNWIMDFERLDQPPPGPE